MLTVEIVGPGDDIETARRVCDFAGDLRVHPPQTLNQAATQSHFVDARLRLGQKTGNVENQRQCHCALSSSTSRLSNSRKLCTTPSGCGKSLGQFLPLRLNQTVLSPAARAPLTSISG